MDLNRWIGTNLDKKNKIILLVVYGVIMFATIMSEINTIIFTLLFVVTPISIYYFVKQIFPKENSDEREVWLDSTFNLMITEVRKKIAETYFYFEKKYGMKIGKKDRKILEAWLK